MKQTHFSPAKRNNYTADYEKVQKIVYDNATKKVAKGNILKIKDGTLYVADEKGNQLVSLYKQHKTESPSTSVIIGNLKKQHSNNQEAFGGQKGIRTNR